MPSILPAIAEEFGLTYMKAGLLNAVLLFTYASCQIPSGLLADKFSNKKMMTLCTLCYSVAMLLTGLTVSKFEHLLFFHSLIGIGTAFYFVPAIHLITDSFPQRKTGRALGIYFTAPSIGMLVAPLIAAPLTEKFGWNFPYCICALPGFILAVLIYQVVKEPKLYEELKPLEGGNFRSFLSIITSLPINKVILIGFMTSQTAGLFSILPLYLVNKHHTSLTFAGLVLAVLQLGSIIGGPLGGTSSDKFGRRSTILAMMLASTAVYLFLFFSEGFYSVFLLVFLLIFARLFRSAISPTVNAYIRDITQQSRRGKAFGYTNMMGFLGFATASITIGTVADNFGFMSSFIFLAMVYLLGSVIALSLKDK